jgi:hypothetical protein
MWVETGAVSVFATKWSRFNGILFVVLVYPGVRHVVFIRIFWKECSAKQTGVPEIENQG